MLKNNLSPIPSHDAIIANFIQFLPRYILLLGNGVVVIPFFNNIITVLSEHKKFKGVSNRWYYLLGDIIVFEKCAWYT